MSKIRILVVDDHPLFRDGIVNAINLQPDMEVVGEAFDGLEALVKARELRPDVILMDINMAGSDGLEGTRLIRREQPDARIVILTVRDEDDKLFEAVKSGAIGYLLKTVQTRQLVDMLRAAHRGDAAITRAMAARIMAEFRRLAELVPDQPTEPNEVMDQLTPREREVLSYVAQGAGDKEVAEELTVSLYTVKAHMRSILHKLQVNSRYEAVQMAKSSSQDTSSPKKN
ncbi:MAG: DNA-binding response regulator [Chloroflexi bacterium]|nr:MAG: DNA-binding response regulator [Chloroflexota bacterium]